MAGKRIMVFALFALAALALAMSARGGAEAQTYKPYNSYSLTNTTPGANSNSSVGFSIAAPDYNYEDASMTILNPVDGKQANGGQAPIGAVVGTLNAYAAVGLLGGPCNSALTPGFTLKNSSVDIADQLNDTSWILKPAGTNPVPDTDGDGLYDYEEQYPWFLNTMLDPDGAGVQLPIQPRARFAGHTTVAGFNVIVQFLVFNPGQMTAAGGIYASMTAEKGAPSYIVLDNPIGEGEATPGAIADFCTPLSTVTNLNGVTADNTGTERINDGCPAKGDPEGDDAGEETWCYNAVDDDGDTNVNDGCLALPALGPENPACVNALDDDLTDDGGGGPWVNDGCPPKDDPEGDDAGEETWCASGNAVDDDGDTRVNDGCIRKGLLDEDPSCANAVNDDAPDSEAGFARQTNPAANTGVLLKGTHIAWNYSQSERNVDGDNFENDLDACRYTADIAGWNPRVKTPCVPGSQPGDQDCDMLPSSCDPNDVPPGGTDTDMEPGTEDGYDNAQDNCPTVSNGCKDSSCGPVFNVAWDNQDDRDAGLPNTDLGPRSDAIGDACDDSDDDGQEGVAGCGAPAGTGNCNDGINNGDLDGLIDGNDPECAPCMDKVDWPPATANPQDGAYYHGYPSAAECVGATDTDGDGYCDVLEGVLGSPMYDGAETNCNDAVDDDGDGFYNDGCPYVGKYAETGAQCAYANALNDDAAIDNDPALPDGGMINDGCPVMGTPETLVIDSTMTANEALLCRDAASSDTPTPDNTPVTGEVALGVKVNDGCPTVLPGPESPGPQCADTVDNDNDGVVNDGCIRVGTYDDCDANGDGDCTDNSPAILPLPTAAQSCSDGIDNDNDGAIDGADIGCMPWSGDADFDGWADVLANGFDANMTSDHAAAETYTGSTAMPVFTWTYDPVTGAIVIGLGADQQCWLIGPGDEDAAVNAEDADCVNSQDDDPADDPDDRVNDGCPAKDDPEGDDPGEETWCADAVDNDGDTRVNDGCPVNGAAPENPACVNNIDDDGDTNVNDGCPLKGIAESSACVNALDDDPVNDAPGSWVNDGCPAKDAPETLCGDTTDDDGDTRVNDGCAAQGTPPVGENASCANDIDDDGDTTVNDGCLVKKGADGEMEAQVECKGQPLGLWLSVDLDADTDPDIMWWKDFLDPRDPTGQDNCPGVWNSTQTNTDETFAATTAFPAGDTSGDACDSDDDADGFTDLIEAHLPTDPLDRCTDGASYKSDTWGLDQNLDKVINVVGDVLKYSGKLGASVSASPPTSWANSRLDLNGDRVINVVGDVLKYSGKLGASCT